MKHGNIIPVLLFFCAGLVAGRTGAEQLFDGGPVNEVAVYENMVWCATDVGALQVDGVTLESRLYSEGDGLPATTLRTVSVNRRGEPWVGGDWGVARMIEGEWETLILPGSQSVARVQEIGFGQQNDVWLCRSVIQYQYNGYVWLSWSLENIWRYAQFNDMDIAPDGRLWLASTMGLFSFADYSWIIYNDDPGAPGTTDVVAVAAGNTDVWCATGDSLFRYHDESWSQYGTEGLYGSIVRVMAIDDNEIAWAVSSGEDGSGLSRFDGSSWRRVIDDSQTGGEVPESIAFGADGTVWIGSAAGLFRFQELATSVNDAGPQPDGTAIQGNYPNPFNPTTSIAFTVADTENVHLSIFSMTGQKVRSLVDGAMDEGRHVVQWDGRADDGRSLASGLYVAALTAGEYRASHRMMLLR